MGEPEPIESPVIPPTAGASDRPGGAIEAIRRRHDELRSKKHLTLQIPGYQGCAQVRYQLLPGSEMDRLGKRIEDAQRDDNFDAKLELEADVLVALCDQIFLRSDTASEWELQEDNKGPMRFEHRLAEELGWSELTRAREIVLEIFSPRTDSDNTSSPRSHPNAMEVHTDAIMAWHRGEEDAVSRRLLGESAA
jgi:hypothetical protein